TGTVGVFPFAAPALPFVTFTGIENLAINGGGGGDNLAVFAPVGGDTATLTPGAAPDSGHVDVTSTFPGFASLTPLDFSNLGSVGASGIGASFTYIGG